MRRRNFLLGSVAVVPAAVGFYFWPNARPVAAAVPKMTDAEYAAILATVRPAKGEDLFAEIPWETNLWDARRKAAKDGKPVLLWEMDGHPLGCG